ncbi:hypothetical protein ACROYT_G008227 [Oculina patagonica]
MIAFFTVLFTTFAVGHSLQCYSCGPVEWQPNPPAKCEQEQEIENCTEKEKACASLYLSHRTDDGSVKDYEMIVFFTVLFTTFAVGYPLQCYHCRHVNWQPNPPAKCEQEQEIHNCPESARACINLYLSIMTDDGSLGEEFQNIRSYDKFLISFDVQSLFTNIPLEETINIAVNTIFKHNPDFPISKLPTVPWKRTASRFIQQTYEMIAVFTVLFTTFAVGYPLQCYNCGRRDWQPNPPALCEQNQEIQNCREQ